MLKGVLHLHSTHSDGEFTIAELRETFLAEGCRFVCISDHASAFDARRLDAYVRDCVANSDERLLFIPGLEFDCDDRMHVLGYGVTELADSSNPQVVFRHIASQGGVSVVAHPRDAAFPTIEQFDPLPLGIEAWNTKYDGRFAPRPATFSLVRRLRSTREPKVLAFYGQDLHWRRQYRGLFTQVHIDALDRDAILAALRQGSFNGVRDDVALPSTGELPDSILDQFGRAHRRSQTLRQWLRSAKQWTDRVGFVVPKPVKAQLRRIF